MSSLLDATTLTALAPTRFTANVDDAWSIGGRPNGGYLLALLQRAATAAAGVPDPLSISAVFLSPPEFGPAEVDVEMLRAGASVSMLRARLLQAGEARAEALVTVGTLSEADVDWSELTPPELPPYDECVPGTPVMPDGTPIPLLGVVDLRMDPSTVGWALGRPGGRPEVRAWMRLHDGSEPDVFTTTVATDALPPVVFELGMFGWAPTVEMTVHVRGVPAPGWLAVRTRSHVVGGGWFDEEADVWDSSGRLVAQARQLARVGRRTAQGHR